MGEDVNSPSLNSGTEEGLQENIFAKLDRVM
jgi:hypothetical protein